LVFPDLRFEILANKGERLGERHDCLVWVKNTERKGGAKILKANVNVATLRRCVKFLSTHS